MPPRHPASSADGRCEVTRQDGRPGSLSQLNDEVGMGRYIKMATTRERLRELLDSLPEDRLSDAEFALRALAIPEDDEPVTEEDREALAATHEAYLRGELIPHDIAMREIGL